MAWPEQYFKFLALLLYFVNLSSGQDVVVTTNSGKITGKTVNSILPDEKYYSFLGIPYARPPVGDLRFLPPEPHPGWEDVLDCKKERKACAQYFLPMKMTDKYGYYGNEDCLTLSIHTPYLPSGDTKLPIIVFLMNENFRMSYNVTKDYGPDFFMKEQVIVVSVNHRLGSLGFLSFEDDILPGNNALRDVILAMQWLKQNIHHFGGDHNRITLMGNQGGAAMVDILLHSPKAKGLFHRAILQSGTSWNNGCFSEKKRMRAQNLAKELELTSSSSSSLVKNLASIDAQILTEIETRTVHADEARAIQKGITPFGPAIEHDHSNAVLTKLPEESPLDIDIPVMIGYNSRESLELCHRFLEKPQYLTFANRDFLVLLPVRVNYHFKINDKVYADAVQEIKDYYFDEGYIKIGKLGEYLTYVNDLLQMYPVDYTVRKYANESRSNVYYYTFDYSGEFNMRKNQILEHALSLDGTWGASLADELCYLFVCKSIKNAYLKALQDSDSEEMKVLTNMIKLWSNFAKSGNPTPPDEDVNWMPATKDSKNCLLINEELHMKTDLHGDRIKFWDEFLAKYETKAIDGIVKDLKDEL